MNLRQLANLSGVSKTTLLDMVTRGVIRAQRVDGLWNIEEGYAQRILPVLKLRVKLGAYLYSGRKKSYGDYKEIQRVRSV